ncbi:MAG: aminotransferase class V-fold PLP-dependent enzyme [Bdellovibrionales bacterium]|nr:aminotransferase class V-fold PLP-dependent enzyme [Bdellovibrionales bacterium]
MANKSSIEQSLRDVQFFGEEGGVVPVIDVAATSTFLNPQDMEKVFRGELQGCYLYSRHSNPTVNMFSAKMAAMEGMEAALGVASGMSAIAATVLQIIPGKGHIVSARTVYGGTYALFANSLPQRGIDVSFVNAEKISEVEQALRPDTKIIYVEGMSNPLLGVSDLEALGKLARQRGIKLVVDNTFTPMILNPARFGADVVIHSCTKYISGGSDLIAGAIVSSRKFIDELIDVNTGQVMLTGPVMDPHVAHELFLRLDHLAIRMRAHSEAALYFARKAQSAKVPVIYPGLEDHPHHALLKRQMNPEFGFGGMLTLRFDSPQKAVHLASMLQKEKFGLYAVSLGFSRTLMTCPALSTSSEIPAEEQAKMGLSAGLLRMSMGYTGNHDVMFDRFMKCYRENQ